MPESDYNPRNDVLGRDETRRLLAICTSLEDGVITIEEQVELNSLLQHSQDARKLYLRHIGLRRMLEDVAGRQQHCETEKLRRHVESAVFENDIQSTNVAQPASRQASISRRGSRRYFALAALAASLLLVASLGIYWQTAGPGGPMARAPKSQPAIDGPADDAAGQVAKAPVARLNYVSSTAFWKNGGQQGNEVTFAEGDAIDLLAGEVELVYASGSRLLLLAPANFVVEPEGGTLQRGGFVASITDAGHGFTVQLPHGKVVDLGTEFGVAIDDFGVAEVNVFEGKVEAFPKGGQQSNQKIELTAGNGLQWSDNDFIPLHADINRFASVVMGRQLSNGPDSGSLSVVDRFRGLSLDDSKWQSLGNVRPTQEGLVMTGGAGEENPPYLISATEYDPALGPVTMTCDFRFLQVDPQGPTAFSVLTRSVDERGIALPPWQGVLASCTRCSFGLESSRDAGSLQAGVKLESDRELSNISWSGFSTPHAGTPYRMIVRDDGVNLSFTVFRRDQPAAEQKNVTVRSLFRGKANHLALEGPRLGQALVERVEILQDVSSTPLASYSDFSSLVFDNHKQHDRRRKLLASLAPEGMPILQDDFEQDELDQNRWSVLGDVKVVDGRVQLGLPNDEQHIDTWKQRPYLLTSKRLDPRDGELTIIGSISFADNFLAGYGGSFAVMTRADKQHGEGPGWENSILQRGVRANFWPAAWDTQHTLEIHEKPAANTITLLAKKGLEVDPETRSYLFRVVDDGKQVTLTIVDPSRPEDQKTVTTSKTTLAKQGFVGFEGCWGSPVMLDDIRVFQTPKPRLEGEQPTDHE